MLPTLHHQDNFSIITFNRPEALNALSFQILDHLSNLIKEVKNFLVEVAKNNKLVQSLGNRFFNKLKICQFQALH